MHVSAENSVFGYKLLVEEARPEKGFFIKSKERCFLLRDDKWHSKFSWEPVEVSDLWVDETDGKCQMHFRVLMADTTRFQVDQPISRQRYNLFVGYKLDVHRVDLIEKMLHGNKSGLCIRKWIATELLHMKVTKNCWTSFARMRKNADRACRSTVSVC